MLKKLIEERASLQAQLEAILGKAKTEERAMTEEETSEFDGIEAKIKAIDTTISAEERARTLEMNKPTAKGTETKTQEELEERAFADYIAGKIVEMRAGEQNFDTTNNGVTMPTTITNRVIKTVKDKCPILKDATIYNVKGTLKIPVYGAANNHDISVGYGADFSELTADAGKFTSVELTGYLIGALSLIGKSLANNSQVDLVNFVVSEMGEKIALFIEKELVVGTSGKCTGALSTTNTMNAGSTTAITADNLIELQSKIKQVYQGNACWTMNPATFTAIKKLKDGNGKYLIQDDFTGEFPYKLLGKPVYLSDNMPVIASSAKAVLYGDYSGLAVNMRENMSIEVLREKYATQHAIGVVGWLEMDSKVADNSKLATLVMSA